MSLKATEIQFSGMLQQVSRTALSRPSPRAKPLFSGRKLVIHRSSGTHRLRVLLQCSLVSLVTQNSGKDDDRGTWLPRSFNQQQVPTVRLSRRLEGISDPWLFHQERALLNHDLRAALGRKVQIPPCIRPLLSFQSPRNEAGCPVSATYALKGHTWNASPSIDLFFLWLPALG